MAITYGKNYGRPTLDLNFAENKSLIDSVTGRNLITFSRSQSGKEATYVGSDGLIKYAGADEARFDYDPTTGESLGLLIEEQRTNVLLNSGNLADPSWTLTEPENRTLTANAIISPDGTTSATQFTTNTPTGFGYQWLGQTVTGTYSNVTVTGSFWAKADTPRTLTAHITDGVAGTSYNYDVTTEWKRFSFTKTCAASASQAGLFPVFIANQPAGITVYLWGAQLEAGSFATSYIPTDSTPGGKTRPADNASITGTNFSSWYNQSEGTIFAGVSSFSYNNSATLPTFAHFTDGSLNNYIRLNSGPAYLVRNFTNTGGVTQTQSGVSYIAPANNSPYSIALGLTTNNARIYADGNPAALINSYSPPVVNKVEIGNWIAQNNTWTNGHLSRLTYWPKRLPDLELQQLTK